MIRIILSTLLLLPMLAFGQETTDTTGSAISNEEAKAVLDHHNKARAEVKVEPLAWSAKLAAHAQEWANHLASTETCEFKHRQNNPYGENIFMSSPSDEFKPVTASQTWYAEKAKYTYGKFGGPNWEQTGHYTQMVWRKTTALGVGMATCTNGNIIVVGNYGPAGNMTGDYPY